jgi:signal transduction histidine kinase
LAERGFWTTGEFVAGIAHEVRNPLFGLGASLDAMEQAFGFDLRHEPFLRMMRREIDRLTVLTRDLLEYGRPPAVHVVAEDLAPVVATAARSCLPEAELMSVRIENEVTADAGVARIDAGRLAHALEKLIQNAVQHSPPGKGVRIVASRTPSQLVVSVLDSGTGFRPEDLPRVFDPFFSRRRGGSGLGLSIAEQIVRQHSGHIEAANRPEGGACVSVLISLTS